MPSGLTFLIGGLLAYALSASVDVSWLIPFAAENFLYIGASDLIPEMREQASLKSAAVYLLAFLLGLSLLIYAKLALEY